MMELHLKDGRAFLEMRCKYAATASIRKNESRIALVVEPPPLRLEDGRQRVAIEIEHPGGPLRYWVADTRVDGPALRVGDLVFWLPVHWSIRLAWMFKSIRRGWAGFIIASIEPTLDLRASDSSGGFTVRHWYKKGGQPAA